MKTANILLSLSKDHQVHKKGVTPTECMLLACMHHKNVGDMPILVDEKSIGETGKLVDQEYEVTEDQIVEKDGKKTIESKKVKKVKQVLVPDKRSLDEEFDRLRALYGPAKVKALMTEVREFPDDFAKAIDRGMKIALPTDALTSGVASTTKGI